MPWPNAELGSKIIEKLEAHDNEFKSSQFAGRIVFTRERDGKTMSINPDTVYAKHRVRKFMENVDMSPEAWDRL